MTALAGSGQKAATGIVGLDLALTGGFPRDRLCLVQGDPGVGKTTLALQFLLEGARAGERGLYVTLSETSDELRAVAASHGWSLDGLALFELPMNEGLGGDEENTLFHPSEVELAETTKLLMDEVVRVRPARVVFDSLSEVRLLAQSPLRYRRQVLALKQFFKGRGCTVLLLDDRTSEPGDVQLQSLAHGVIALEQLSPLYGSDRRRLRVLKMRGVKFRGGYHDFTIETGGMEVYPRLVANEHHEAYERRQLPTGVRPLDELLAGGLDYGSSTLFMGPAGSGKSTLALHYVHAALSAGEPVSVYTFDESIGTMLTRARSVALDLPSFVDKKLLAVRQVNPAELTPGEFAHHVRREVEERGVKLLVIDSLNGYMQAMPEEQFLNLQLHELLTYLGQMGVITIMIVAQHGLVGTMQSPVDVSYLADTVLLFRHYEIDGHLRKAVSVLKKRMGSHQSTIHELRIGRGGISLGQPLQTLRGVLTGVPGRQGADAPFDRSLDGTSEGSSDRSSRESSDGSSP